ncbi:hypothetical protein IAG44_23800 [Streptomyces roseirectus]|uniref:Uncharacterized protein n=1 Tax=Streptomyces roseirectus TaxID=2768066 RepID=A0A7H0IH71_9ACTN|nr:hypothetical protein [Streptomyces roseirectus]QNP72137.1 hypothetical protein IAG44_23800 [Streptomyces roseirectus]
MPAHLTLPQLAALTTLTLGALTWLTTVARTLRRPRHPRGPTRYTTTPLRHRADGLPALPHQRRTGPAAETVRLTPAEEHAFATLVRQLAEEH